MVEHDDLYTYRSGTMMVLAIMFLTLFTVGLTALVLLATGLLSGSLAILAAVALVTTLLGVEVRPEGLRFTHLIKPAYTITYDRITRMTVRMLRGMYYCFMRWGSGLFDGTFFPVGYWTSGGKEATNAFMTLLAERAHLVQTGRTPLGAPIYERPPSGR
ncbi:MAG: hypothetical protein Kow00124_25910 [Anaerolineae bacterium]